MKKNDQKIVGKRIWRSIVTTLASIVVFVTTYAMIIPAITWDMTLICELEEHIHGESCYDAQGELQCAKQEHTHTAACFDAPKAVEKLYICGKAEHTHSEDCYFSDGTLKCTMREHLHTAACRSSDDMFALTAYTGDGIGVMLTGLSDALPFPAEEITLTVTKIYGDNAAEQLSQAAEADGVAADNLYLLDVTLWHDGEPVEPTGTVTVTFLNMCSDGESASVYHVDPETGVTTNMDAATEDGNAVIDTDHFSIYGVVVNPASGKNVSGSGSIDWDSTNGTITAFTVTASSSEMEKATFCVQYSDDGTNWTSGGSSAANIGKNKDAELDASSLIGNTVSVNRQYRAYAYKDANNSGYSTAFTLTDLFEEVKPGFTAWLANDYIQNFGGTQPVTQGSLITAFALYESLPTAKIGSSLMEADGIHKLMVDVSLDNEWTGLTYQWEYLNKQTNEWTSLTTETGSRIDATNLSVLNGGTDVRCKVYDGSTLLTVSNILNVNNSLDVLKNETSVKVVKKWSGSKTGRPDSVTVRLCRNGDEVPDASVVLSESNHWAYIFDELPYHDGNGAVYEYTVTEDEIEGFNGTVSDITVISDSTKGTHYLTDGALSDGASYAMVSGGYVIGRNGSSLSGTSASTAANVTYDGVTYSGEVTNVPAEGGTWTVTVNSDGTTYTFKCGDSYLAMNKDGNPYLSASVQSSPAATSFSIDEYGHISALVGDNPKQKYIKVSLDKGAFKSLSGTDKSSEASVFTFYQAVNVLGAYDRYEYKITNRSSNEPEPPTVEHNKYIDYLGDGGTNPDTTLAGDFYRQYLDMEICGDISYDFLFVVDNTSSMLAKDLDGNTKKQRDQIVCEILNGTYSGTSTGDGILTQILRANPENKIAVATFCGISSGGKTYNEMLNGTQPEVHTILDWCGIESAVNNTAPYADVLYKDGGGTCYAEGLLWAEEMMQDPDLDDGNMKIVIFLGDGEPNGVLLNENREVATAEQLSDKDHIKFQWEQIGNDWSAYLAMCIDGTVNAMDYFLEATEGLEGPGQEQVELYTIAVGTDFDDAILETMAEMGKGARYTANSIETFNDAFGKIISRYLYDHFVIADNLSKYTEVYKEQMDLRVTRVEDGQETVIWQGGWDDSGNIGAAVNGGESYIQSVTFTESTGGDSNGTLTVTTKPNYIMEHGVKYIVSYNLKATDEALEEYEESGYGSTIGDNKTDYPGNTTSSGKPGFYSNEAAAIVYRNGEELESGKYPHPVIQLPEPFDPTKEPDPFDYVNEKDIDPTLIKQIDYLGDNGITDVDGIEDLYRLYVTMDMPSYYPMDLLLVIDQSGSMLDDINGNKPIISVDEPEELNCTIPFESFEWDDDEGVYLYEDDDNGFIYYYWDETDTWIDVYMPEYDDWAGGGYYDLETGEVYVEFWDWFNPEFSGTTRQQALLNYLNGTENTENKDGFIYKFLDANPGNRLAVLTFSEDSNAIKPEDGGKRYILPWCGKEDIINSNCNNGEFTINPDYPYGATNYTAAFNAASAVWKDFDDTYINGTDTSLESDQIDKVMIFLSDGVPTIAYSDGGMYQTYTPPDGVEVVGTGNDYCSQSIFTFIENYFLSTYKEVTGTFSYDGSVVYKREGYYDTIFGAEGMYESLHEDDNGITINGNPWDRFVSAGDVSGNMSDGYEDKGYPVLYDLQTFGFKKATVPDEETVPGITDADGSDNLWGEITGDNINKYITWYNDNWKDKDDVYKKNWVLNNVECQKYDIFHLVENSFSDFRDQNENVRVYSIGYSNDFSQDSDSAGDSEDRYSPLRLPDGRRADEVLNYIVGVKDSEDDDEVNLYRDDNAYYRERFFPCTKTEDVDEILNAILGINNAFIFDPLSDYVDLAESPKLEITLKLDKHENSDDTYYYAATIPLFGYDMSKDTYDYTADGLEYLDTQKTGFDEDGNLHVVFKQAFFNDFCCEASFNVRVNQYAKDQYLINNNTYNAEGDEGTDYQGNATSSGKPGFYSNDCACDDPDHTGAAAGWKHGGSKFHEHYDDPVVQVSTLDISLDKIDAGVGGLRLQGAEFDLYRELSEAYENCTYTTYTDETDREHYLWKVNGDTLVSKKNASIEVKKLTAGRYYLVETKAPDGYILLDSPLVFDVSKSKITLSAGETNAEVDDDDTLLLEIKNSSGYKFPSTGGSGTETIYVIGALFMFGAVMIGHIVWRRHERRSII